TTIAAAPTGTRRTPRARSEADARRWTVRRWTGCRWEWPAHRAIACLDGRPQPVAYAPDTGPSGYGRDRTTTTSRPPPVGDGALVLGCLADTGAAAPHHVGTDPDVWDEVWAARCSL